MQALMKEAGLQLHFAFEKLNTTKLLHPFLTSYLASGQQKQEFFKDISLENSIPKAIDSFEDNIHNATKSILIYPAQTIEDNIRKDLIIIMVKDFSTNQYLTIAQFYEEKESNFIPTLYELLDFSYSLAQDLPTLEKAYRLGAQGQTSLQRA